MCGIVGYTGNQNAAQILLEGLRALEYRGYDSAGVAAMSEGVINVEKASGRIANLCEKTDNGKRIPGFTGIGHTRWATHGAPTDINAHPHLSNDGRFAVVHNGIIENYASLREELLEKGYSFLSQTDTEVVVHLIEMYYKGNLKTADDVLFVSRTKDLFSPMLTVIPLQLLAYYTAKANGRDIDKPRNLAKSVTVE